jgi:hypothetical protein
MSRRSVPTVILVPLLVVALVVSSSACGTMANLSCGNLVLIGPPPADPPPPVAFGGVQWDIERAIKSDATAGEKVLTFPLWFLDLSLSATLDTATLPMVFWINARRAWDRASDPTSSLKSPPKGTSPSWGLFPDSRPGYAGKAPSSPAAEETPE